MKKEKNFKELDYKQIGNKIRAQRKALHLSREQLASEIDISSKFLVDIENGDKGMSLWTLYKLIQHLNISADFLLKNDSPAGAQDDIELNQLKENILAPLSVCNVRQLKCVEQIVHYYVEGLVISEDKDNDFDNR